MSIVSPLQKQALHYISNTECNATLEHFIEDHVGISSKNRC